MTGTLIFIFIAIAASCNPISAAPLMPVASLAPLTAQIQPYAHVQAINPALSVSPEPFHQINLTAADVSQVKLAVNVALGMTQNIHRRMVSVHVTIHNDNVC